MIHKRSSWCSLVMVALVAVVPLVCATGSGGQTTSITSSGLGTQVTPSGHNVDITGGTRPANGPNLFHSFGNFSVGTGDAARFLNDSGLATTNILSRVTGGNVSNIFGEINTTNFPGANLYLINPAGVVFGPTASLNVGGSVKISTADYLRLSDGVRFNAVQGPQDALLSTAPVAAFGFLTDTPRPISVQGATLQTELFPGDRAKAISLVGGDIAITGATLKGSGGIDLISVASRGEVSTSGVAGGLLPAMGHIALMDTVLDSSISDLMSNGGFSTRTPGAIEIRGGQLVMDQATVTAANFGTRGASGPQGGPVLLAVTETIRAQNSRIESVRESVPVRLQAGEAIRLTNSTVAANAAAGDIIAGGSVALHAPSVVLDASHLEAHGNVAPGPPFFGFSTSGGSVTIQGNQISLQNGSSIVASGAGSGFSSPNSNVMINATQTVRLDHSNIEANLTANSVNSGGRISILAGDIVRLNHAVLSVDAPRATAGAGNIVIEAGTRVLSEGSTVSATSNNGPGGNILLQANEAARLVDGTSVAARGATGGTIAVRGHDIAMNDSTLNAGGVERGGTITLQATDRVAVSNSFEALSVAGSNPLGIPAPGGSVMIQANQVRFSGSGINATGTSDGGTVTINANDTVRIDAGRIDAGTSSQFGASGNQAGTIGIQAGDSVRFVNGTVLAADNAASGSAGTIHVDAGGNVVVNASRVTAEARDGQPGQILISAGDAVRVLNGSRLSVNNNGVGPAGTMTINAGTTFVGENSQFLAQTGEGHGGTIVITAPERVRLTNSQVNTSVDGSPASVGGTIQISSETIRLQNSQVSSNSVEGNGGTIVFKTNNPQIDEPSTVEAVSLTGHGANGTFTIEPF